MTNRLENALKSLKEWWFNRQDNRQEQEPLKESRDRLLVVATLIAAVTFQAGVSPPGGVWQDSSGGHFPGQAICASQAGPFYVFLVCNILALSFSINLIISLTCGMPFFLEVMLATGSMAITYGSAIFAVTPKSPDQFRWLLFTGFVPFFAEAVDPDGQVLQPEAQVMRVGNWSMLVESIINLRNDEMERQFDKCVPTNFALERSPA